MARRHNPWPAFSDLFSLLMVITLGIAVIQHQAAIKKEKEDERAGEFNEVQAQMRDLVETIKESLKQSGEIEASGCEDEVNEACIDLGVTFERDSDEISETHREELRRICEKVKAGIDGLAGGDPRLDERVVEVIIEGHTDSSLARADRFRDAKSRYLYNYDLSARRAQEVLFLFQKCGIRKQIDPGDGGKYRVLALGYADTKKRCETPTEACDGECCDNENRRMTLRLRVDPGYFSIAEPKLAQASQQKDAVSEGPEREDQAGAEKAQSVELKGDSEDQQSVSPQLQGALSTAAEIPADQGEPGRPEPYENEERPAEPEFVHEQ